MKNFKILLIAIFMLKISLLAINHNDNDGFTHSIITITDTGIGRNGYIDNNEEKTLTKRTIDEIIGGKKSEKKVIYGDIETIGATVVKTIGNSQQNFYYNYNPWSPLQYPTEKTSITKVEFEKEDNSYTTNSAKATFKFSDRKDQTGASIDSKITGEKIIFARLYWGASIVKKWSREQNSYENTIKKYFEDIKGFNKIKFGYPNDSGGMDYKTLNALEKDTKWFGSLTNRGFRFQYQASYDVTDIVKKALGTAGRRTFSAGDIKVYDGAPPFIPGFISLYDPTNPLKGKWYAGVASPTYGGWALVIVYDFGTTENHNVKPKGINIYDGIKVLTPLVGDASTEMEFKDFYTPIHGDFDASLTILSFGAAKEIPAENIQLKKNQNDSYSDDDSVYVAGANSINPKGSQFNSTIARFNEHMNSNKIYNASMDLDIYDISSLMDNGQTHAYAKLSAKVVSQGGSSMGDEATVGLVAFSTDLYVPNVCYEEKLFYKRKNDNDAAFREVSKSSGSKTILKKDDILRVELSIKNKTNERVEKLSIIASTDPTSGKYDNNSTYIYKYKQGDSSFLLGSHNPDNTDLQKKIANGIKINIGQGANNSNGGKLDPTDSAFIRYDIVLNETFKESTYKASFSNDALNLEYNDGIIIKKCEKKDYFLSIFNIAEFKAVNHNFTKKGDSERLYTQLAGKGFNTKIVYMHEKLKDNETPKGPSEDLEVSVEVVEDCDSDSIVPKIEGLKFNKNTGMIEIPQDKLLINNVYPSLTFRLSYIDPAQDPVIDPQDPTATPKKKIIVNCLSDRFSVRPEKFRMYNTSSNSFLSDANLKNLIGGRNYSDTGVVAVFKQDNIATGYTRDLQTESIEIAPGKGSISNIVQLAPNPNEICINNINSSVLSEITGHKIRADFNEGKANFYKSGAINFSYPDIGPAKLTLQDSSFTLVDRVSGDCIADSDSTTPNAEGKIGCDIKSTFNFTFLPNDIFIDNVTVSNFENNMTYTSSDSGMYARVLFDTKARIDDAAKSIAKLYTRSCYANNVNFTLDIDQLIPEYKIGNNGKDITNIAELKNDLLFFDDTTNLNIRKTITGTGNTGQYQILNTAFSDSTAIASGEVRFNFDKNITSPRNPFAVNSNIFTFNNISDTNGVAGAIYSKPSNETNADFYYGRVYATKGKGPKKGFDHNVYFGVYCNLCDTDKYTIAKNAELFPDQTNWFVNKEHDDINMGEVKNYKPNSPSTNVSVTKSVQDGIEKIFLSSSIPGSDTIKMEASSWLLFNQVDSNAKTNDFIVEFTDGTVWGGQSLNKAGENKAGVGSVIGGSKLEDIPSQTNRRLEW
ncbi:hypothetical protein [Campylobacter sp. RM16191]|uniref:hypothetical protein n=1 Tax=Campylobacter sp. RM16191 TaxID=1705728 RepID=UPI001472A104|nr:hypothetical protein [Campylobacter sp. RM16191]